MTESNSNKVENLDTKDFELPIKAGSNIRVTRASTIPIAYPNGKVGYEKLELSTQLEVITGSVSPTMIKQGINDLKKMSEECLEDFTNKFKPIITETMQIEKHPEGSALPKVSGEAQIMIPDADLWKDWSKGGGQSISESVAPNLMRFLKGNHHIVSKPYEQEGWRYWYYETSPDEDPNKPKYIQRARVKK